MADTGASRGSPLGQSLATNLSTASDNQRAALPALASSGRDAATTAQYLATAAHSIPPAAEDSASTRIKRSFSETDDAESAVQCCKRGDGRARQGVNYQAIPDEEYWRYNRYLDKCAIGDRAPADADDWQVLSVRARANSGSGYGFEREVRETLDVPTGPGSRPTRTVEGYVPDLPVGEEYGVTDIKNVATLSDSAQLTAFHRLAESRALAFNLIVGPATSHISGPLLDRIRKSGGTVHCYDPSDKSLKPLVLPSAGYWSK